MKGLYGINFSLSFKITILLKDVTSMTKEKTAKLIPNAIQISTDNEKVWRQSNGSRLRFNAWITYSICNNIKNNNQ